MTQIPSWVHWTRILVGCRWRGRRPWWHFLHCFMIACFLVCLQLTTSSLRAGLIFILACKDLTQYLVHSRWLINIYKVYVNGKLRAYYSYILSPTWDNVFFNQDKIGLFTMRPHESTQVHWSEERPPPSLLCSLPVKPTLKNICL